MPETTPGVAQSTSLFLDAWRLAAASAVFLSHVVQLWYPSHFGPFSPLGHQAVVVFFVLSGYVIALTTIGKARDTRKYVLARVSRLYSVVLPALALTLVCWQIGRSVNPTVYASLNRGHESIRYVLSATFCQEVWGLSASPPSNSPFWSLGYEAWYYALFGAVVFVRRPLYRLFAVGLLGLAVGPKVLILWPVWLLGVGAFVFRNRFRVPARAARALFWSALAAFAGLALFLKPFPQVHGYPPLFYSASYVSDFLLGVAVAGTIFFFDRGYGSAVFPTWLERPIRWTANHSFSLYLYHYPLLILAVALLPSGPLGWFSAGTMAAGVLGCIFGLSTLTESKRGAWRTACAAVWDAWSGAAKSTPPGVGR